ncbi:MAG: Asp-tRNA(Asn)/Glu-tRNA(Gln) amidotransferase subunit GatA [Candidatus Micrarchaeota archaeon]|nr:Asp-tRNA(Asn)/Glu-tRNA(Gln) amidotransferase subunit GatA [Candidatus Micrarchaeota archaeon]MDE1848264.1 Asp-tRNA(Asn)/Glu-tRNA(Gln) amidotransferase subunit GatA [Candidatus Micrarchaeota archaeon]MDE1864744.1 Asp-tRNA(Asn)/Glu-tRNA(Gln) amidotransferase subunit GatA [Candidatus Micrarchaeota archaeon]
MPTTKPNPKFAEELSKLNKKLNFMSVINSSANGKSLFSVKDNLCVKGFESRAGSKILSGYIPPFNATAVQRMLDSGYEFVGKTVMDEFGFGSFGTNTDIVAKNPFDETRVAGGSSSGAAVATAVIKNHVAIAESTGGSISNPASFCGVVGFTPTYGTISRYGLIDYANSLDKVGVMGRRAADIRAAFDRIKGADNYDSTCSDSKISSTPTKKLMIIEQLMKGIDSKVLSSFDLLLSKMQGMGYKVEHASLDIIDKAIPAYYIISMAEASTNLAKYDGYKYGEQGKDFTKKYNDFFCDARSSFGIEAKRRIVLGTFVRSASVKDKYYIKALKFRTALTSKLSSILKDSFLISPTMPTVAPKIDEAAGLSLIKAYSMDSLTIPPNLSGLPHISFPCGYANGMPIGAQLISSHFNDYALLDFVESWEKSFKYEFKYNL